MRYYEDTSYYHFSTSPTTDAEERSVILEERLEYTRELFGSSFKPADNAKDNVLKYGARVVFILAVILLIVFSTNGMVGGVLYTFGGMFVLFGIMAAIPAKPAMNMDLPGKAKLPRGVGSVFMILFGLAVIVPAAIAPAFGFAKSAAISAAAFFLLGGLFFAIYTCIGIARYSKASKETVPAK